MTLFVFAGPNGSGKSTLVNIFLNELKHQGLPYICPDASFSFLYPNPPSDSIAYRQCYIEAMVHSESLRRRLLNNGDDFAFETVFSTIEKVDFLREAKKKGYLLSVSFVTTDDPNINIDRVAKRVEQGGHDVPADKIIQRYHRSMELLRYLFELADELSVYDNSAARYRLVYQHSAASYYFNPKFVRKKWVRQYLVPYMQY